MPSHEPDRPRAGSHPNSHAPSPDASTYSAGGPTSTGDRIGPYVLLGRLGQGGMGRVLLAEQTHPIHRKVALKLIRADLDGDAVVARFESERQALALLNHPNIAQVYDAGTTPDGQPYFAMEYVPGRPITEFAREQRLSVADRLALFVQVCEGVQHAHQKGIIHRDLKPSNILISTNGDAPAPKIIDFGVAKATAARLTDRSLHTLAGQVVGTPSYMSPEQAAGGLLDVDTRTDVYALGVLLYELLAGVLPFGSTDEISYEEYLKRIRTEEPKRPTTRMAALGEELARVATEAHSDPVALLRSVRGDLDWIALKALEKDRNRRYVSASELAEDVRRHLRHEPVIARPPSAVYRFRKFARRNRAAVVAGALVGVSLILGIVGTTIGMARARSAERAALEDAEAARQTTSFLLSIFKANDAEYVNDPITVEEMLRRITLRIQGEMQARPLVKASLLQAIANRYQGIGAWNEAAPLYQEVYRIRRALLPSDDLDRGRIAYDLGRHYVTRGELEPAKRFLGEAESIFRARLGPLDKTVAWCQNDLAMAYMNRGDVARALPYFQEALRIKEIALGSRHPDTAGALNNLGYAYMLIGKRTEARRYLEAALHASDPNGGETSAIQKANLLHSLGALLYAERKPGEARSCLVRALAIQESLLVSDHPDIALTLATLAPVDAALGRTAEATSEFERAASIYRKAPRQHVAPMGECLDAYAHFLESKGRSDRAQVIRSEALYLRTEHDRAGSPHH